MTYPRPDIVPGVRVFLPHEGNFGTVETVESENAYPDGRRFIDVRLETPDGEPSVLVTCLTEDLVLYPVPPNVVRRPVSREWRRQSAVFCQAIERILRQHFAE